MCGVIIFFHYIPHIMVSDVIPWKIQDILEERSLQAVVAVLKIGLDKQ